MDSFLLRVSFHAVFAALLPSASPAGSSVWGERGSNYRKERFLLSAP